MGRARRAVHRSGLHAGSYWHVYPSHTDPHHQAELWMAAIRRVASPFSCGHWADITTSDGLDADSLGHYLAAFLGRMDALLGEPVGVFTSETFWREHVALDVAGRPQWSAEPADNSARWGPDGGRLTGARTRAADRGGPGSHRVHWAAPEQRHRSLLIAPTSWCVEPTRPRPDGANDGFAAPRSRRSSPVSTSSVPISSSTGSSGLPPSRHDRPASCCTVVTDS